MKIKSISKHHKLAWAISLSLIVLWLVISSIGGPSFGKLSNVTDNNQESFLPASADSTKVAKLQGQFIGSNSFPAVVLITNGGQKINQSQMKQFGILAYKIANINGVGGTKNVIGPIPSKDMQAVEYIVQLKSLNNISDLVKNMRNTLNSNVASEQKAYVTGPVGIASDLFGAFKGIDGKLLYVTFAAVFIILILVYRAVILPFLVLITASFALTGAGLIVYHGVLWNWFKLNGQSQGILSILVIGACTDYALLITARFRESLTHHEDKFEAMLYALKRSFEPIVASGLTVIVSLLCLLFSDLNSNKSLGPVAACGIAFALLSALTFLPAVLALLGRKAFWPLMPKFIGEEEKIVIKNGLEDRTGIWKKIPEFVSRRARPIWIVIVLLLIASALNVFNFKASGVKQTDSILGASNAVEGQKILGEHFPAGSGSPLYIVTPYSKLKSTMTALSNNSAISSALPVTKGKDVLVVNNQVLINATLVDQADSSSAKQVVKDLRVSLPKVAPGVLIGGTTAVSIDSNNTARRDLRTIAPIVYLVILLILVLLLRSLLAPLILIFTVILSFLATIGISAFIFNNIFHFPGSDAAIPLFGFIFLVALGIDYNIFLMTRVREEAKVLTTRPGILRGLSVTGSVITSAGIVLASTFAALTVIPILFLVQIAFIVSFGVLLDTIIVRTLLVSSVSYDIGKYIWWPRLLKKDK